MAPGQRSAAALFALLLAFAPGHFLSCLLRAVNAVLTPELTAALQLDPAQLGMLSGVFLFGFALAQLPIGYALDQFGPRRVQLALLPLAAAGMLLFARGHDYAELLCARAVMGVGLGGCFMAAVKALSASVPAARLASMHGYLIAVGGLGAAAAGAPVAAALRHTDWRGLFAALAGATLLAGVLVHWLAPREAGAGARAPVTLASALAPLRERAFRDVIAVLLPAHAVFFGLQGYWIGNWLGWAGALPAAAVARLLSLGMGAVILGALAAGKLAELAARRGAAPRRWAWRPPACSSSSARSAPWRWPAAPPRAPCRWPSRCWAASAASTTRWWRAACRRRWPGAPPPA